MNRISKINKIMQLRADWALVDYEEAYSDIWDHVPNDINKCKEMMEEYITNTYDDNLLNELLESETNV